VENRYTRLTGAAIKGHDMDGFSSQLLATLGYQFPELLAGAVGLAMLSLWAPASPGRALALGGVATILIAAMLRLAMSVGQAWMIYSTIDGYSGMAGTFALFSAFSMLLGVLSSAGLVMLAWGACKAMQAAAARA